MEDRRMIQNLVQELAKIVGSDFVTDDYWVRRSYSMDSSMFELLDAKSPAIVVRPGSIEELQEIVRLANKTKTPIYVRGGGTACAGTRGTRMHESILIDTTRMDKIVEIDEESLTVTAEAGVTWGRLNAELEKRGWRLGVKGPYSGYAACVGGSVAYNAVAYASTRYGLIAEEVISLKVVLPNGDILVTGTATNPNAKRYYRYANGPDLTGLFIGSLGTLGIIAEVTLRMYPKADYSAYGAYTFKDYESAHACYYNWLKHWVAEDVAWYFEDGVSVMTPELYEQGYVSLLTYVVEDVTDDLVNARKKLLDSIALKYGGIPQSPEYARQGWIYRYELLPRWAGKIGMWQWTCHLQSAGGTLRALKTILGYIKSRKEEMEKKNVYTATVSVAERNCGHISTSVYYDQGNPESVELAVGMAREIARIGMESGGATYKPGELWYPHTILKNPVYREALIRIKKALDPNNIMNPGALSLPDKWEEV
ncbi:MAG: FAD-binding oxidoreductase [Candidatus Bathyarchaeia archaeon]